MAKLSHRISIVVALRNEERHLGAFMESIAGMQDGGRDIEFLVAEGGSSDRTRTLLIDAMEALHRMRPHWRPRILDNPSGSVPAGLNHAIRHATGDVLLRMDGHTRYPPDYLVQCLQSLERSGAANVGGVVRSKSVEATATSRAISRARGDVLGAGTSSFRTGGGSGARRTVPFGCWRRETLETVGLFDERLLRNQDLEFNHRIRRAGGLVYQEGAITSEHIGVGGWSALLKKHFRNGLWNVRASALAPGCLSGAHFIPGVALLAMAGASLLSWKAALIMAGCALALDLGRAIQVAPKTEVFQQLLAFVVIQVAHGAGQVVGMMHVPVFLLRRGGGAEVVLSGWRRYKLCNAVRANGRVASIPSRVPRGPWWTEKRCSVSRSRPGCTVWLVNQFFWPDVAATAQLLSDLAQSLRRGGRRVHALAAQGRYARAGQRRLPRHECWEGVEVTRVRTTDFGRMRAVGRLLDYAGYMIWVVLRVPRFRRRDTVLCLSTPPMVAVVGALASYRGCRFVYKVEDLYPDLAAALGAVRVGCTYRLLQGMSRAIIRRADAVVVLSHGMATRIASACRSGSSLHIIRNWADGGSILPKSASGSEFRKRLGVPSNHLVVGYSGNMGLAHAFNGLIGAMMRARQEGLPLTFLFTGGGARRRLILAAAFENPRIIVRDYEPRESLSDLLAASDVHVVSVRPAADGLLYPSKVAGVLAAGRPLLFIGDPQGDVASDVIGADVGWAVPDSADEIYKVLCGLAKADLASKGRAARRLFEAQFTQAGSLESWDACLSQVEGRRAADA